MNKLNQWYLRLRECQKGQTMAEYGLILAAVATLCFAAYKVLGGDISALITAVAAISETAR
jgi:Flp pilus assembly pilin Flp